MQVLRHTSVVVITSLHQVTLKLKMGKWHSRAHKKMSGVNVDWGARTSRWSKSADSAGTEGMYHNGKLDSDERTHIGLRSGVGTGPEVLR